MNKREIIFREIENVRSSVTCFSYIQPPKRTYFFSCLRVDISYLREHNLKYCFLDRLS